MEKYQFEEITAALSILICLFAKSLGINWLYYIYFIKSIFDTYCAIYEAYKHVNNNKNTKTKLT